MSDAVYPIELVDIDKIKPYEKNAKRHDPESVSKLARSIKEFGWDQPIVVDVDGVIIKGHGRRLAAIELGRKKVPVVYRRDLTKAQAAALRLSDNQVVSTEYDMSMVQEELRELDATGEIDMSALGYDEKELEFSLGKLDELDESAFIEDVGEAVERQKHENEQAIQQIDDVAAPVADAFGFKRVTIAQSRTIRDFMNRIESQTGKKGVEALIDFIGAQ